MHITVVLSLVTSVKTILFFFKRFDSVDDESKPERHVYKDWTTPEPPLTTTTFTTSRDLTTFVLRPRCGEASDTDHLTAAFLTSYGINHSIPLRKVPALKYLSYLAQIGVAMSSFSNNTLLLTYERNPFPQFFQRDLNISTSSGDPYRFGSFPSPTCVSWHATRLSRVDGRTRPSHIGLKASGTCLEEMTYKRQIYQIFGCSFNMKHGKGSWML
ncbi:hypothetical protein K501DRAFT_276729 [Backusella circina FSU 941]|nr:hypothetical protein K501DRAFT_281029 [Backusella circina FSU 941]KAI8879267.1 hypothetical protein K501DRAFT_276729 [Backusella circina FSU 941]